MSWQVLVLRYTLFAVLATLANLAVQRLVFFAWPGTGRLALALGLGTLVGLVVKYALDKRWIFADTSRGMRAHGQKFALYSAMGLVTTALFWGTETAFWLLWGTEAMRELGAVLGLSVGYVVKYNLDKRYVFSRSLGGAA